MGELKELNIYDQIFANKNGVTNYVWSVNPFCTFFKALGFISIWLVHVRGSQNLAKNMW
jgi:hypothetical protein